MLTEIDGGGIDVFAGDPADLRTPMGVALDHRPSDSARFAIVSRKTGPADGYLWQYRITGNGNGGVRLEKVRQFGAFSGGEGEIETIAVDDESGFVYDSDEWAGVRKYAADPDAAGANRQLAVLGATGFKLLDRDGHAGSKPSYSSSRFTKREGATPGAAISETIG
ncbi:MAG TPA: phytase [Thermoanaerobaculia bacterium]|nr:phytase [Thermoanaerobaculia bacterium]